jgi:CheY-like chemotaxis protein
LFLPTCHFVTDIIRPFQACHYAEAVDGQDAIQRFKSFHPDLVLLDINMPRKDGFAAASEMRAYERSQDVPRRAKIIAVTAMGGEAARRRGLAECGIDEWRTKPVGIKDLREDVERLKEA